MKYAHNMGREFKVLSKLHAHFDPAPEPVTFCDAASTSPADCFLCRETGALTREELIRIYGRRTGHDTRNLLFHYALALYKLAVIGQQIYYRDEMGLRQAERFAAFSESARSQAQRAAHAIETRTIKA